MDSTLEFQSRWLRRWANLVRQVPKGRYRLFQVGWKFLGAPERFIGELDAMPFVVDMGDRYTSLHMFLWGCYEPAVTRVVLSLLKPGAQVMDIGANKGYFSVLAARRVGTTGHVFSYEPVPRNIDDLLWTRDLGEYAHWHIFPIAISSEVGRTRLREQGIEQGHSGWSKVDETGNLSVLTATVDAELERLDIPRVDLLKMDIEGHEIAAFQGMKQALAQQRIRHLLVELHLNAFSRHDLMAVMQQFSQAGYTAHSLREEQSTMGDCLQALKGGLTDDVADLLQPFDLSQISGARAHVLWSLDSLPVAINSSLATTHERVPRSALSPAGKAD